MKNIKEIPEKNLNVIIYALIKRAKRTYNKIFTYEEAKKLALDKLDKHKRTTIPSYLSLVIK